MCNYCEKEIIKNEELNLGYKADDPLMVCRIQYKGFCWDVWTQIPLNYCPACGAKLSESEE